MSTPTVADGAANPATDTFVQGVEARLDRLSEQLSALARTMASDRLERERWHELVHELTPIAQRAMTLASDELEDLSSDITIDDAVRLARTAARAMPQVEALLSQLGGVTELAHELTALAGAGIGSVSETLASAERRGYFTAARHGAATVDRWVSSLNDTQHAPTPSSLALLRQLRDPQVRRGLVRTIHLLRAMGADPPRTDRPVSIPHPAKD
jgi:uncharacterized protein YjgD (DUF1641 family)